jgi:hypothetical protein
MPRRPRPPRLGQQTPRYRFFLNPYQDARFTRCPICRAPMRQRKLPLVIHVDPMQLVALNKTCRYCPRCDLLIAHQDEVEGILAALFSERQPEVIGNDYLVIGTVDRPEWKRGIDTPLMPGEMLKHLHDFKEVLRFEPVGGWVMDQPRPKPTGSQPRPASQPTNSGSIYQLKITLKGVKPPIWRRIQVPGEISLSQLHEILQTVMGWHNYHLYAFKADGTEYGEPDPDYGLDLRNARTAKLNRIAPGPGSKLRYQYDFGDDWQHEILVEKVLPPEPGTQYPICLAGRRACPPEDCGGFWGYAQLLEALRDPAHPEHESLQEWVGGYFDPEAFDLEAVNQALRFRSRAGPHA